MSAPLKLRSAGKLSDSRYLICNRAFRTTLRRALSETMGHGPDAQLLTVPCGTLELVSTGLEHKDVILGVLAASSALSGLVLVFLGLIVTAYSTFEGDVPKRVKASLRRSGAYVFTPFILGIFCISFSILWMILPHSSNLLYVSTLIIFIGQLIALVTSSVVALKALLWD